jgi:hypothetical protein
VAGVFAGAQLEVSKRGLGARLHGVDLATVRDAPGFSRDVARPPFPHSVGWCFGVCVWCILSSPCWIFRPGQGLGPAQVRHLLELFHEHKVLCIAGQVHTCLVRARSIVPQHVTVPRR